jgi:hypothetical protein
MSSEFREIQRKVREAARRREEDERRQKESIKQSSAQSLLDGKIQLQEEINRKRVDYTLYFILPAAAFSTIFAIYMIFQVLSLNAPGKIPWDKPRADSTDIPEVSKFISESLSLAKRGGKIDDRMPSDIPRPWREQITANFSAAKDQNWQISKVTIDERKRGISAVFISEISGNSGMHFTLDIIRYEEKLYLLKASKIEGEIKK